MPSITLADEDDEESGSVVPAPMTRPTAPGSPHPAKNRKGPNEAPRQGHHGAARPAQKNR